jgi:hypothetical protein
MPKGKPACTAQYHPAQGENLGTSIESYGAAGDKEPMPSQIITTDSEGSDNAEKMGAFARSHGMPTCPPKPPNATGSIDDHSDNPSKGEHSKPTY